MVLRAKRSLKATPEGLKRANQAVLSFATKIDLAIDLELSRATVQNFFAGKPVGRENFHKICHKLELPWREIAELTFEPFSLPVEEPSPNGVSAANLVEKIRELCRPQILQRCGLMRVLDMTQPLELDDIYTSVNILEKINGRRRLDISDLLKLCISEEFERPGLGRIAQERVPGRSAVEKYSKLMVLGKPGAGKTTFLKHIALQCVAGTLVCERVPFFIPLKDFAETEPRCSLREYISAQLESYGVSDQTVAERLLLQGQALVLLDGLDEVEETDAKRVLQEVRQLAMQFHTNQFVISCRLATREYTLEQFTEVEVADFDLEQIASFTSKWFTSKDRTSALKFQQKLQTHSPIRELATNPLLLTLLCLVFEESADFPANRSELYQEGLHVLLRKWDAKRNIERSTMYQQLSVQHKEDLLGQIARRTFERGEYFFRQQELEQQIGEYIENLPSPSGLTSQQLDSEAILKALEAQHGLLVERARGIYSFSHLTFQEYFTARELVASSEPKALDSALQLLVSHISDRRWREVFLLSVGMLRSADYLLVLIKQQVDSVLASDQYLQAFLVWVNQKAQAVSTPYQAATVRAFYFDLDLARVLNMVGGTLDLARSLDRNLTRDLDFDLALDLALDRTLALNHALDTTIEPIRAINRVIERARVRAHTVDAELERSLQQLKEQLADASEDKRKFEEWWKANGGVWTDELRGLMIKHRNFGHNWHFSEQQTEALKQYYDANQLLVDCLNSNCYVTRTVREEILETLLLPPKQLSVPPEAASAACSR